MIDARPVAAVSLCLGALTFHASAQQLTKAVMRGDAVPGLDGVVIEKIGLHTAIENFLGLSQRVARIDEHGNIAFHAFIGEDGVLGQAFDERSAFFRVIDGELELVLETTDPAPGLGGTNFSGPGFFPTPPIITNGRLRLFHIATGFGLWDEQANGEFELIMHGNVLVPEGPNPCPTLSTMTVEPTSGPESSLQVIAFYDDTDCSSPSGGFLQDSFGLFLERNGRMEFVAANEAPIPGFDDGGAVFGEDTGLQRRRLTNGFRGNSNGEMAFHAWVDRTGTDIERRNEAIFLDDGKTYTLIVAEGDPVPAHEFGEPGFTFSAGRDDGAFDFGFAFNDPGSVIFHAFVEGNEQDADAQTLWRHRPGSPLELLWRNNDDSRPVPGIDATWFTYDLFTLDINNRDAYLFRAFVDASPSQGNTGGIRKGAWVDRGEGLELIAIEGMQVPGFPGETFNISANSPGTQPGIGAVSLTRDGSVLFNGFFRIDGSPLTRGTFAMRPDGSRELLIHNRMDIDLDGDGSDVRTVDEYRIALSDEPSLNGEHALQILFTDGSDGLFLLQTGITSQPDECPGDCDDSGTVDFNDLVAMLFEFQNGSAGVACDADRSGTVDFNDLVEALFLFGPCP